MSLCSSGPTAYFKMSSEFPALGDGIDSGMGQFLGSNPTSRFYPSLDSLASESLEEIDSDVASNSSNSKGTPPMKRKFLFPKKEYADHLQPEEVRWFYKREADKKWTPFIGYDSLRIECRYRVQMMGSLDPSEIDNVDIDLILVRGGLYEVNVLKRGCSPVYWNGEASKIMRGTWFYEGSWQPMDVCYATQIETEHLSSFLGHRLDECPPPPARGPRQVLHHIKFQEFYIDWYSPSEVYKYSDSKSSRLIRAVGNKFGVKQSTGGTRIFRGFCNEAVMDDKPVDITHLVFVVHGIGQKMETGAIVKSCQDLSERVEYLKQKYFPDLERNINQRAEFLPVEWRSSLKLDGDTVETLTPQKMKNVRTILNSSAMDILYYSSPLYRTEITYSLETELNRLYKMFCTRHPYFEPNGGKVSVIAHSLGCVIAYDIITGWNPIHLYDQFVSSVIDEEKQQAAGSSDLCEELEEAQTRVNEFERMMMKIHDKQEKETRLSFQIENMFCLGSPLGVFLALRGVRPQGKGTLDHIIPSAACKRLFNIYHPSDPVAYRLEPLILKHYSSVKPLTIHNYHDPLKEPYNKMNSQAYSSLSSTEMLDKDQKSDISDRESVDSSESFASRDALLNSPQKGISVKVTGTVGGWFQKIGRSMSMDNDAMSAELRMFDKIEKEAEQLEAMQKSKPASVSGSIENIDQTDLEYRLDYQLRDTSVTGAYIAMFTSHTSYWTNKDVAFFMLSHLHPELQES